MSEKRMIFYFSNDVFNLLKKINERRKNLKLKRIDTKLVLLALIEKEESTLSSYLLSHTGYLKEEVLQIAQKLHIKDEGVKGIFLSRFNSVDIELEHEICNFSILMAKILSTAQSLNSSPIEIEDLVVAMFIVKPRVLKKLFQKLDGDLTSVAESIVHKPPKFVPRELKKYLSVYNNNFEPSGHCSILKREDEIERIWAILQKQTKRNVMIIGYPGVGKKSIVNKLTYDIVSDNCPEEFKEMKVLKLNVNSIMADLIYLEDNFNVLIGSLIDFLEQNPNIILYIPNMKNILMPSGTFEKTVDMACILSPIFENKSIRIIGILEEFNLDEFVATDILKKFEIMVIREQEYEKIIEMLAQRIEEMKAYHEIEIGINEIKAIVAYSKHTGYRIGNPEKSIEIMEKAMSHAKVSGEKRVEKRHILKALDMDIRKLQDLAENKILETAYHEAGHYIVWKYSGISCFKMAIVSIIPTQYWGGVNLPIGVLKHEQYFNRDYFIKDIAISLGGREGEKAFTETDTYGAISDLHLATAIAIETVSQFGLSASNRDDFVKNRVYSGNSILMGTEKIRDRVNVEVNEIIRTAENIAKKTIENHADELKMLAEKLAEEGILFENELNHLFEKIN